MNREEYAQTMIAEVLKLMKIDDTFRIETSMYIYEEVLCLIFRNHATDEDKRLFLYIELYNDTEEQLFAHYNTLMDYADRRYEAIFGKGE